MRALRLLSRALGPASLGRPARTGGYRRSVARTEGGSQARARLRRRCSRTACGRTAQHTLTYVYADQTAVLGPLATFAEPHAYDLCEEHSRRLSAPRGWEVLRLAPEEPVGPSSDDLLALADAVREAGGPLRTVGAPDETGDVPLPFGEPASLRDPGPGGPGTGRRGHLRVLRDD